MISIFFKALYIRFLTNSSVEIKWDIENTPEDIKQVSFVVYKSETPEAGYTPISPELTDLFTYRDAWTGYDDSKFKIIYYKVRAFIKSDPSKFVETKPDYVHENPEDDSQSPFVDPVVDAVRRANVLLSHERYRVGKPCIVYQKRTFGQRCKCFDPILQRVTKSKCEYCLGTGRIEGYHSGIEDVFINFVSLNKTKMIQFWGDTEPGETQAWTSNFPIVKPEDIIINKLTNEYYVIKRIRTSFHLIPIRQTILVRKLNFDDIKTSLPFDTKVFRM